MIFFIPPSPLLSHVCVSSLCHPRNIPILLDAYLEKQMHLVYLIVVLLHFQELCRNLVSP